MIIICPKCNFQGDFQVRFTGIVRKCFDIGYVELEHKVLCTECCFMFSKWLKKRFDDYRLRTHVPVFYGDEHWTNAIICGVS